MLHAIIKDENIGYENKELDNPKKREGARGIVLNNGKVALFYKKNKNEYKLPGGGVEKGESFEDAFRREALEETGCIVEIDCELGITEEKKGLTNFYQLSHVFLSHVIKNSYKLNLTEKENLEGGELLWVTVDEAIRLVENCFDKLKSSTVDKFENVYATKFIIKRDLSILKYYQSIIDKQKTC